MAAPVATRVGCDGWEMWCPGCEDFHAVNGGWGFNGDVARPTFSPSILVQYGNRPGDRRCHSFLVDGKWQFLPDCTHTLAGQTVDAVPWPGRGES